MNNEADKATSSTGQAQAFHSMCWQRGVLRLKQTGNAEPADTLSVCRNHVAAEHHLIARGNMLSPDDFITSYFGYSTDLKIK